MNTRIKKIRKTLDLTQQAFAEKIGLKQNSIALIESGKRNISDQAILSICREFDVNEQWLKKGEGEMFKPAPSSALDALAKEYNLTNSAYVMVEKFVKLRPEAQKIIFDYIQEVAAAFHSDEISPMGKAIPETDLSKLSIDEKVELYRQELEREEKAAEKSEVS